MSVLFGVTAHRLKNNNSNFITVLGPHETKVRILPSAFVQGSGPKIYSFVHTYTSVLKAIVARNNYLQSILTTSELNRFLRSVAQQDLQLHYKEDGFRHPDDLSNYHVRPSPRRPSERFFQDQPQEDLPEISEEPAPEEEAPEALESNDFWPDDVAESAAEMLEPMR
jgi:hypothetical protein